MYWGLTVLTPGCVAFRLPVQRRTLRALIGVPAFLPIPPQPAQRAADPEWRFLARAAFGPRSLFCSRAGFRHFMTDLAAGEGRDKRQPGSASAPRWSVGDK